MSAVLHPSCDRVMAECARAHTGGHAGPEHPRLILATTILASSLAFIDGSVVNVGLPDIGRSLHASGANLAWVVNGYTLPLSALLLFGGALGDSYGRRRLLLFGVALFAMASVLCMVATNLSWLIAGRVLQGVGSAMLMPNSLAILGAHFAGEARGRAIGIWAAIGAAAGALGPVFGGSLIDLFGWRTIFVINLPVAAATLYLAARCVPNDVPSEKRALDLPGAALASVALTLLTWALTVASSAPPLQATGFVVLAAGVASLVLFVVTERRRGGEAMLPLALFASRPFVALSVLTLLLYGALGGLLVAIPFVLIEVRHYSATAAGAALLPLPLIVAIASPTMGRLAARVGPRLPLTIGPAVVAVGCLLATAVGTSGSYWLTTLPGLLAISLGMSASAAPLTTAVLGSVEAHHVGVASGFNSAVARTGGLIATGLLSALLGAQGGHSLASYRVAAIAAGLACALAALCAFTGLRHYKTAK
jgi:EmrB/QacA subfamily drug resistance transporter